MRNIGNIVVFGIIALILLPVLSRSCSNQGRTSSNTYMEEGLDKVIKSLRDKTDYTIVLHDMNAEGDNYFHKYQILTQSPDSTIEEKVTDWYAVSDRFFQQNIDNLGMEVANKKDNELSKQVAPAGYSQYVGNPNYGKWVQRDGGSFWEFYGKFALMSSVFNMMSRPAYYDYYNTYNRNYRGTGQPYYGSGGYYGTKSYTSNTRTGSNTTWGRQPQSFKQRVQSRVSRSTTRRSNLSSTSRTSRSGNRFSGSSTRSRGGGFGK